MLTIRRATPDDAAAIVAIHHLGHVERYVGERTQEEVVASINNQDEMYLVAIEDSSTCVGFAYLVGLEDSNLSVELRQFAIGKPGAGYGRQLLRHCIAEVFKARQRNRLWLDVFPDNTPARRLYASCGFVEEGTLREVYFWKDSFHSTIVMSMLSSEFRSAGGASTT